MEPVETLIDRLADAVKQGLLDALASGWASAQEYIMARGDQVLLLSAMMGLVFYGAGSRTAGKVIWWSVALFILAKMFGIYAWGFFGLLLVLKFFVGRA